MQSNCKAGQQSLVVYGRLKISNILLKYQQVTQMNNPLYVGRIMEEKQWRIY